MNAMLEKHCKEYVTRLLSDAPGRRISLVRDAYSGGILLIEGTATQIGDVLVTDRCRPASTPADESMLLQETRQELLDALRDHVQNEIVRVTRRGGSGAGRDSMSLSDYALWRMSEYASKYHTGVFSRWSSMEEVAGVFGTHLSADDEHILKVLFATAQLCDFDGADAAVEVTQS